MRSWRRYALIGVLILSGCDVVDGLLGDGGLSGPPCTTNGDCVSNGCCGKGTDAVHSSLAPTCAGTVCDGKCSVSSIKCGCGVPVCRQNRCTVALSATPDCD